MIGLSNIPFISLVTLALFTWITAFTFALPYNSKTISHYETKTLRACVGVAEREEIDDSGSTPKPKRQICVTTIGNTWFIHSMTKPGAQSASLLASQLSCALLSTDLFASKELQTRAHSGIHTIPIWLQLKVILL